MKKGYALTAASLMLMAVAACDPNHDPGQGTGLAKVTVALELAEVDHVTLTVTGGETPIVVPMTKVDDTHYNAAVNVVTGTYTLTAEAFNAGGDVVASGSAAGVAVSPPGPVAVYIVLHEPNPPVGPTKKLPQIASVVANPTQLEPGATSTVAVDASSPESHPLTYQWSDSCGGSFADSTAASTVWTAPGTEGDCLLSVKVSDATNETSVTVYIKIKIIIIIIINANAVLDTYPIVTLGTVGAFIVTPEVLPSPVTISPLGITADLVATASDPDGSVVTYKWAPNIECPGTFTPDDASPNVQFHTDDPTAKCTLTLTVSDTPPGDPYPAGSPQSIVATVVLTQ